MPPTIPTIDLSLPHPTVVDLIRTACLTHGFFQITKHQFSPVIHQTLLDYVKRFFALPISEKNRFKRHSYVVTGYEAFQTYSLQASRGKPDLNESFTTTSVVYDDDSGWPVETEENGLIGFKECCRTFHPAMEELSKKIAGHIAEGLGLDKTYFDDYFYKPSTSFRMIHYFTGDDGGEIDDGEERIGAGLHSDWSLMTVLWQDNVGGLQVLDPDSGEFIPVHPVEGALVVNAGDLLSRFTNGVYPSPQHRVIAPPPGSHRYSIPFFCHGNPDYLVDVLPLSEDWKDWAQSKGKGKEAGSAVRKWEPITSGGYLEMKFKLSKVGSKEATAT